jgi:SAM-dependent methyltransferase
MFFDDPVAAFTNIGRALRPGGRLALLAWREFARNDWLTALRGALAQGRTFPDPPAGSPGPFGLADDARNREILAAAGFEETDHTPVDEPAELGKDVDDAFTFVRAMGIVKGLTEDLDENTRARALDDLYRVLAAHETPDGVLMAGSAWLVTARRPDA